MADEPTRIRLNIDGRWTATDMSLCFQATSDLYALRTALTLLEDDWQEAQYFFERFYLRRGPSRIPPFMFRRLGGAQFFPNAAAGLQSPDQLVELLGPEERLQVQAVQYGSEGFKDFTGIGTAIGHLKDLVIKLIDIGVGRNRRAIEEEGLKLDNEAKRLKNAREYLALAKEVGCSEPEIRQMVLWSDKRQVTLVNLAEQGKLIGVDQPSSKDNAVHRE
ncbi:MAG: hypothetical protein DDT34_02418 [Firmicutes bacterium]|nr:hypothetical protein [Bacillota bacterium]